MKNNKIKASFVSSEGPQMIRYYKQTKLIVLLLKNIFLNSENNILDNMSLKIIKMCQNYYSLHAGIEGIGQ